MQNSKNGSTRTQTRESGVFIRASRGSSALERGLLLLRAFLTSAGGLTNAELAMRCALPRSTVSRLTRSLVDSGFLEYDLTQSAYRLAPVNLSLAAAYRRGHSPLADAASVLREAAIQEKVNLGLAVADGLEMVYLESFREGKGPVQRVVPSGARLPIESYASGHAFIAAMSPAAREKLLVDLARSQGARWPQVLARIERSGRQYARRGYCSVPSVPGLVAIATALRAPDGTLCAVILSDQDRGTAGSTGSPLPDVLMHAAQKVLASWG